jgi:transposase
MAFVVRKTSLKRILRDTCYHPIIDDLVKRANDIVTHAYRFINLYVLHQREIGQAVPILDEKFISAVTKVVSIPSQVQTITNPHYPKLAEFGKTNYIPLLGNVSLPSRYRLTEILAYEVTKIRVSIENNVKKQFMNRFREYINMLTKYKERMKAFDDSKLSPEQKNLRKRRFANVVRLLKNDIIDGTFYSNPMCYQQIREERAQIVPSQIMTSVAHDLESDPLKFLPGLLYLHSKLGGKFRALPLRTSNIPAYITIDTTALLIISDNRSSDKRAIGKGIWENIFCLEMKDFKTTRTETFHYFIETDGVGVSLVFETTKKPPSLRKAFKKCSPEHIEEETIHYVQHMNIGNRKVVGIDPGKQDLLFCVDGPKAPNESRGTGVLRHTQIERNKKTKKRKNQKLRNIARGQKFLASSPNGLLLTSVEELESSLSQTPHKVATYEGFVKYVMNKIVVSQQVRYHYEDGPFGYRKRRWHTFVDTQRCNAQFMNKFEKTYGKPHEVVVCFGNYGNPNMNGVEPSKGKSFRKLFRQRGYPVFLVDEFQTSCTCTLCSGRLEKFHWRESHRPTNERELIKVHGLLRCKTCNSKGRLWNRDLNAALNIWKIAVSEILGFGRPQQFQRGIRAT